MLSKDWITAPAIDLELKQYLLLAYLQRVDRRFGEWKLYPHLQELRDHMRTISDWEEQKAAFISSLPERLTGLDAAKAELRYEKRTPPSPAMLQVIEEVMGLAEPKLQRFLSTGQELREAMLSHIEMRPVGLVPIRKEEGYIMLHHPRETRVYGFAVSPLITPSRRIGSIRTHYVTSYVTGLQWHPARIRLELIQNIKQLPEPLTVALDSDIEIPCVETFLPIAKQLVISMYQKADRLFSEG